MKTFSKSLLASLVGVVVLASQTTVFADPVGPSPKITGIIGIVEMKVDNVGPGLGKIICPLSNKGATPLKVTYDFSKWTGSGWHSLHTGSIVIPAKDQVNAVMNLPRTKEDQRIRLDVLAEGHIPVARELKFHARSVVYVLQYKTRGWVQIAYQFQKGAEAKISKDVKDKIAEAKALGFKTKRETEKTYVFLGTDSYRTYTYAEADDWKEKSFETKEERDAFHRKLAKLVPSLTDNKSDPTKYGPGLETKLIEK